MAATALPMSPWATHGGSPGQLTWRSCTGGGSCTPDEVRDVPVEAESLADVEPEPVLCRAEVGGAVGSCGPGGPACGDELLCRKTTMRTTSSAATTTSMTSSHAARRRISDSARRSVYSSLTYPASGSGRDAARGRSAASIIRRGSCARPGGAATHRSRRHSPDIRAIGTHVRLSTGFPTPVHDPDTL